MGDGGGRGSSSGVVVSRCFCGEGGGNACTSGVCSGSVNSNEGGARSFDGSGVSSGADSSASDWEDCFVVEALLGKAVVPRIISRISSKVNLPLGVFRVIRSFNSCFGGNRVSPSKMEPEYSKAYRKYGSPPPPCCKLASAIANAALRQRLAPG